MDYRIPLFIQCFFNCEPLFKTINSKISVNRNDVCIVNDVTYFGSRYNSESTRCEAEQSQHSACNVIFEKERIDA